MIKYSKIACAFGTGLLLGASGVLMQVLQVPASTGFVSITTTFEQQEQQLARINYETIFGLILGILGVILLIGGVAAYVIAKMDKKSFRNWRAISMC